MFRLILCGPNRRGRRPPTGLIPEFRRFHFSSYTCPNAASFSDPCTFRAQAIQNFGEFVRQQECAGLQLFQVASFPQYSDVGQIQRWPLVSSQKPGLDCFGHIGAQGPLHTNKTENTAVRNVINHLLDSLCRYLVGCIQISDVGSQTLRCRQVRGIIGPGGFAEHCLGNAGD